MDSKYNIYDIYFGKMNSLTGCPNGVCAVRKYLRKKYYAVYGWD